MNNFVSLEKFYSPDSVAIIGASSNSERIGGRPLRFFKRHGFKGNLYPVNPSRNEIDGLPCYASVNDIPGEIDLAIIAVDSKQVIEQLQNCADKEVKFAVIFSGGFGEAGQSGAALQHELINLLGKTNIRVSGPNTIGSANLHNGVCPSFAICLDRKIDNPGPIGFVSQSGAFGSAIVGQSLDNGNGIGAFTSTGNEIDLCFSDYAYHLLKDQHIKSIAAYVEGLRDGAKFLKFADRALIEGKPITVLKVGASKVGASTANSHTGSMTGSDKVYDAVFNQKGILRARNTDELLEYSMLCAMAPKPAGNRVAVLSISGGANVLIADECAKVNLELPKLSGNTVKTIKKYIPSYGSANNPIDLTGQFINQPDSLPSIFSALKQDTKVDSIILFMSVMYPQEDLIVSALADAVIGNEKPIIAVWTAGPPNVLNRLRAAGVIALPEPTRAVRALAGLSRFAEIKRNLTKYQGCES